MKSRGRRATVCFILLLGLCCFSSGSLFAQVPEKPKSMLAPSEDSIMNGNKSVKKTKNFFDSIYQRFKRHKFTKMLYSLAFVAPQISTLPDTVQALASENPYKQYEGKIIRRIRVVSLDPFGPTVIDTARQPTTGFGKFLNVVHIQSAPFVIKKMALIRQGQALDPYVMADQERILKDLSYIDDARVTVIPTESDDSVDVLVVTKDVWSIGAVIPVLTTKKMGLRLFDANFGGLGDRLSLDFSFDRFRAPFARFDGFSYTYTNILGTFTDLTLSYHQDDMHQVNIGVWIDRPFVTNRTKYAGGISYQYNKLAYDIHEDWWKFSKSSSGYLWFGRSYQIAEYKIPTRFIASASFQAGTFLERPSITVDSNRGYYDMTQVLGSVAFSRNNYYLIDYFLNFGKTENIPYGRLIQLTFGPQFTNFYTRLYSGVTYSQGNFIKNFGYLQGRIDLGWYYNHRAIEDGVFIARLNYMSYLYFTPDKRYKFRTYILTTYRQGFLRRSNNLDFTYIDQDIHINKYSTDTVFKGVNSISMYFSTVMFTPWYFYGFRFALTGIFAGGFKSDGYANLFQTRFYTELGVGFLIRNESLIFPTFLFSIYVYPTPEVGVPWLQTSFSNAPDLHMKDYNPSAPSVVSIAQ